MTPPGPATARPHAGRCAAAPMALVASLGLLFACPAAAAPDAPALPTPISSKRSTTLPCRDALFIGARGSGEVAPYGPTVTLARDRVLGGWRGSQNAVYVDYPAADPHQITAGDVEAAVLDRKEPGAEYFRSVQQGVVQVRAALSDSQRRCPRQRIVLAGFSQGAQVIDAALSQGAATTGIAGTLLVGDPLHFPGQNAQEVDGQVATPAIGLAAMVSFLTRSTHPTPDTSRHESARYLLRDVFDLYEGRVSNAEIAATLRSRGRVLPAGAYATTYSVCARGDLVCDAAPPLSRVLSGTTTLDDEFVRTRPIHGGYEAHTMARSTAAIAAALGGGASAPGQRPPAVRITPVPRTTPSAVATPRTDPARRPAATPAATRDRGPLVLVAGLAALVGAGIGWFVGRRSR